MKLGHQVRMVEGDRHGGPYRPSFQRFRDLMHRYCGEVLQVWVRWMRHEYRILEALRKSAETGQAVDVGA